MINKQYLNTKLYVMNSQTRLLNLLSFQGNSSGKTENFISSAQRKLPGRKLDRLARSAAMDRLLLRLTFAC